MLCPRATQYEAIEEYSTKMPSYVRTSVLARLLVSLSFPVTVTAWFCAGACCVALGVVWRVAFLLLSHVTLWRFRFAFRISRAQTGGSSLVSLRLSRVCRTHRPAPLGHMLTAQVALDSGIMSAASTAAVQALVDSLQPTYPRTGASIAESACWADDLKAAATGEEASYHFIDLPIVRDALPVPVVPSVNVVSAITGGHTTAYSKLSASLDKARWTRFIIHFVGDVHQPLHAAELVSNEFPNGDAGGNLYKISLPPSFGGNITELHALWDSGCGQWVDDLERPLNATGTAWVAAWASKAMAAWPASSLGPEIAITAPSAWANESYALASNVAYTAPEAPAIVPQAYLDTGAALSLKRIALGGYRLASLLEYIFHAQPQQLEGGGGRGAANCCPSGCRH